jgi:hypothetical protein
MQKNIKLPPGGGFPRAKGPDTQGIFAGSARNLIIFCCILLCKHAILTCTYMHCMGILGYQRDLSAAFARRIQQFIHEKDR